jgi:hypothetical protein
MICVVSLQQQRKQTVESLAQWLKDQFSSILEELKNGEYWDYDASSHVSFENLSKNEQAVLMGRKLREVLEGYIRQNYTWSRMTENSYVSVVLSRLGCIRQKGVWLCPLKPKN